MDYFMLTLPYLAFLGLLLAIGIALVAYFWPSIEWRILCWLEKRRRDRERRPLRTAKRGQP